MLAGVDKIVPEPHLRANLIRATHLDTGHFGIKETNSLLEPVYIWAGMYEQVRFEVRACAACDRVKASFEVRDTVLKPLPIMGLIYRWGEDLCKMPHTSEDGNKYVVVMIEHFTKWVELVPIPEKSSFYTAAAIIDLITLPRQKPITHHTVIHASTQSKLVIISHASIYHTKLFSDMATPRHSANYIHVYPHITHLHRARQEASSSISITSN
jgi:hypothetical protein